MVFVVIEGRRFNFRVGGIFLIGKIGIKSFKENLWLFVWISLFLDSFMFGVFFVVAIFKIFY